MVLHGKQQDVINDVCEVGKVIMVKMDGVSSNMFNVLAKTKGGKVKAVKEGEVV